MVKSVTNENVTNEELGGAGIHARKSGVSHFRCENEEDCYRKIRKLLELIPHNNATVSQITYKKDRVKEAVQSQLNYILPSKSNQAYDMQSVIELLLDTDSFLEVQKEFAPNMIIGFGRLYGECVGIVANQPNYMAGVIDSDASDKAARFIRYCDAFNIPLVTLVDVPGFMPGTSEEYKGIIRHGAKMLYAYSEATTVKLTVILRKAYGGAYIAMCSKHLRADMVYAWESAEIAVMGAEGAVEVLYSKDLKKLAGEEAVEYFSEKVEEYKQTYMNSTMAAQLGYVDAVIQPSETREELYHSIMQFQGKRSLEKVEKKHGNMPL